MAKRKVNSVKTTNVKKVAMRRDSMVDQATGMGTRERDKLLGLTPSPVIVESTTARQWFRANGFMQNIVNGPAEDALREWITIKTNRDDDLNISRLIDNRLYDLKVREKLTDLIRYSRMYNLGGFLFFGVLAQSPQVDEALALPMPRDILQLDYLNVFGPDWVSIRDDYHHPLGKNFRKVSFSVSGVEVHDTRIAWLKRNYSPEEKRGVSVIETVLDSIKAQDTSLWSATSLLSEMSVKILQTPLAQKGGQELADLLHLMRTVISTQGAMAIADNEQLTRLNAAGIADSGLKQIFDFIFENLAGMAQMPKSRIMGQSQGVITAGQFDLLSYYESIARFQELEVRPILEKIIELVICEKNGNIYRALGGQTRNLDWELEFNPMWRMGPVEQAETELKEAQADTMYVNAGVVSGSEVRNKRFKDLEDFSHWQEPVLDFSGQSALGTIPMMPLPS